MELISKVSDESIRQEIIDLLQHGDVKMIISGLDGDAYIEFVLASGDHEYVQGFIHVKTDSPNFFDGNKNYQSEYNQIRRYEKITENWYEYIYALADIKDADQYRLAAWNHLGPDGQKNITTEWSQARVTLIDWKDVAFKEDNEDREFVVSVQFRHNMEGILGPITLYFDPITMKYVGHALLA